VLFAVVLALALLTVGYGYATDSTDGTVEDHFDAPNPAGSDEQVVPSNDAITVVATDSNSWLGERAEGPRALAELVAFGPDGDIYYYDESHTRYWDVDSVPGTRATVEYGYADHLDESACPDDWDHAEYGVDEQTWDEYSDAQRDVGACTRNGYERVNLSTGEVTPVWSQVTPGKSGTRYHDVDRINETHLLVADIYLDGVFVVDAETDSIEWRWNASDAFSMADTGGPDPEDWSHINDVERLDDGRIMVSARNHDRVLFLNRSGASESALVENWTLGAEDDYDTLYEQHNPDYISEENGGPAVVVGDSENNRVVEYQRTGDGDGRTAGEWEQSWTWRDARMQWPRDADRLPNGHTLVTDSNGNRVFEVDEAGEIVWSVDVAFPYEAERLPADNGSAWNGGGNRSAWNGGGDESTDGPSAHESDIDSRTPPRDEQVWIGLKELVPGKYLNGLMYVTPTWMGFPQTVAAVAGALATVLWLLAELYWAVAPRFRSPGSGRDLEEAPVEDD
jgi:hypothetical protein